MLADDATIWARRFVNCTVEVNTTAQTALITNTSTAAGVLSSSKRDVFVHAELDGVACFRIPKLLRTTENTILAFAEARRWIGDGCFPADVQGQLGAWCGKATTDTCKPNTT